MNRMQHPTRSIVLGCALVLAAGSAQAQEGGEAAAARSAIDAANTRFVAAFAARDAAALTRMYAEDAQVLPPGSMPVAGRAAIEELWGHVFEAGLDRLELSTGSFEAIGDLAVETGTATLYSGDQVADVANYVVVWRRQNGEWLLYRDIWNSQKPPTPAP